MHQIYGQSILPQNAEAIMKYIPDGFNDKAFEELEKWLVLA